MGKAARSVGIGLMVAAVACAILSGVFWFGVANQQCTGSWFGCAIAEFITAVVLAALTALLLTISIIMLIAGGVTYAVGHASDEANSAPPRQHTQAPPDTPFRRAP